MEFDGIWPEIVNNTTFYIVGYAVARFIPPQTTNRVIDIFRTTIAALLVYRLFLFL